MHRLQADHRDQQPEEAGDPAFQRILDRRHRPGDQDAEDAEQEILEGPEAERDLRQHRRDQIEAEGAEQAADQRGERRQPERLVARPDSAMGNPSTAVAALAGVPGMLRRMALRLPP